jgi:hypothetical protein
VRVNFQETVLHIRDGATKLRDMPMEWVARGDVLAE